MKTYKIEATRMVYFTVLVQADNDEELDEILPNIYAEDCYEHESIDFQIDAVSEASEKDITYFPILQKA